MNAEAGRSAAKALSEAARRLPKAGADDDLREEHVRRRVQERRDEAQALRERAEQKLRGAQPDRAEAERLARSALERFARCLDWAEDTDMEGAAHRLLDRAGRWVHATFGCQVKWDGANYVQDCPLALAHNRLGMSVGGVAKRKCSLCAEDVSECEHLPGVAYLVPGGVEELGWCRICLAKECDHTCDDVERVSMVSIIYEMDLEEVSLVAKPAHPEARLTSVTLPTADLREKLGPTFVPGVTLGCDRCAVPCPGLTRHGDWLRDREDGP